MMDFKKMMQQAQQMQFKLQEMQEKLKDIDVEGEAGGGMVKAFVNGQKELMQIKIEKDIVDPDDVEFLEDTVLAAINVAMKKAEEMSQEAMNKITGGINLPGMF